MMEEEGHRRSTRAALAEIPQRLGLLRVSPPRLPEPLAPLNLNAGHTALTPRHAFTPHAHLDNTPNAISSAFLSPTPSPDELVIQQRGRRRIPVTWSPDIDFNKKHSPFQSINRTPPKVAVNPLSPLKNGIVLRSTPRKRLLMNDVEKPTSTTEKVDFNDTTTPQKLRNQSPCKSSPVAKRFKFDKNLPVDHTSPLDLVLKGLSNEQLISIISGIVQKHPEIDKEVRQELPLPDIKPLEENLQYLKKNIYRSLPTSRLTSKTDSPAYSRAATHINAFKKQLVENGRTLADSQHWQSVLEYCLMSWMYVKATPLWDNHPHNSVRRQCFKYLSGLCIMALKKGQFDKMALLDVQGKLKNMLADSEDIQSCLKLIDVQIKSLC